MYTAIIVSALLYTGAYVYPNYLYLGVFLWIMPLFVTDDNNAYGFKAGYTWGLLFFGGHLAWLAYIVYTKGQGCSRMVFYFAAVAYFSLFSGFWLWFKQLLVFRYVRKIKNLNRKWAALCCTWVISTVTFICLTCYCSLAICGCFEGYPFINPLLPLVSWTSWIRPIFQFGTIFYWILIVVVNLSIANFYKIPTINSLIFACLIIFSPSIYLMFYKNKNDKNFIKKSDIIYLQPTWNATSLTSAQTFYEIGRHLDKIAATHPDAKFIVIPESGFAYNLMDWENKLNVWTSLFDDITIFIGGHFYDDCGNIFNSLYQISDGKIIARYDKQHLVPFVERIPHWISWMPILKDVFADQSCYFSYPDHDQSSVIMAGFKPRICSELFFTKPTCGPFVNKWPILFICNDSWFALDYARNLAKRSARLYSLQYHVTIVYVGWYDGKVYN